jgi:hypothetical protein
MVCVRRRLRLRPAVAGPGRRWGGGAGAAQVRPLLLRRPATAPARRRRAATPPRRQVRLRRPHHLAGPDHHPHHPRRPVRHRDRAGVGGAAPQAAPPPGHGTRGPRPIVRGTILRVQVERIPAKTRPPKCCGCGGPAPASPTWTGPGGPTPAASTASTRCGFVSRRWGGPPHDRGTPPRLTAGPGWCWPHTPSSAWPASSPTTSGWRGSGPDRRASCRPTGSAAGFRGCCARWLTGHRAETLWALPRPAQGQQPRARHPLPGDQKGRHQAQEEGHQDHQGRLTTPRPAPHDCPRGQQSVRPAAGLKRKLRG